MPPKKDKKSKKEPQPVGFRDLPPAVRKNVTEFLQPTVKQQERLNRSYELYARQRNSVKFLESNPDMLLVRAQPGYLDKEREWAENMKGWYERDKERYTKAPGIHETYSYFWDDRETWPDQGPDPDMGGGDIITT
jgi:hypothetical protein